MEQHFEESNLTTTEAAHLYSLARKAQILPRYNDLSNPFAVRSSWRRSFSWRKQLRIKKITEQKYEFFYYYYNCPLYCIMYGYQEVDLADGTIAGSRLIESWQEFTQDCP